MNIEKINIKNFRNLKDRSIGPFSEDANLITGPNGSGKTNILEALGLSAIAKSCRGARTREMVRFGSDSALIEIQGFSQKKKLT
jgi:DNA replication and repair protein RecF